MIIDSLKAAAKKMMIDFNEVTSKIDHKGERGNSREELLISYLKGYFPSKYQISKGSIIDVSGTQSKQQDFIIYDAFSSPILMNMESTKIIPIESVYATIEIKSSLNKTTLLESVNNVKSVRSLPQNSITPFITPTAGFIFAFTSDTSLETLMGNLYDFNSKIDPKEQVSAVCVLDKGLIVNIGKFGLNNLHLLPSDKTSLAIIENPTEHNLLQFYLIVMQFLNSAIVSPPNLLKYLEAEGLSQVNYSIPGKYLPNDSTYEFAGRQIDISNAQLILKDYERLNFLLSGEANAIEVMEYFNDNLERIIELSGLSNENVFAINKKEYNVGYLRMLVRIYNKVKNGMAVSEDEIKFLKSGEEELVQQFRRREPGIS
ncbi:DUF6602 domain-containing protein [Paenibacillus jamilae]|uniref:DUF6602 domain-containing protein n=1 Tax=Paenibacillus jamilae TaxID=114136 RepID=UPI003D2C9D7C